MSARRVAAVLAAVVAIPTACLLGVLALGRALEESQVAEGTLTTPEEAARRAEENRRRFLAMTPAEHLAGARHRLSLNPRPGLGAGGDLHGATLHLDAISPDAGVHAEVAALRGEIDQRRLRIYAAFEGYVLRLGPTPGRARPRRPRGPRRRAATRHRGALHPRARGRGHHPPDWRHALRRPTHRAAADGPGPRAALVPGLSRRALRARPRQHPARTVAATASTRWSPPRGAAARARARGRGCPRAATAAPAPTCRWTARRAGQTCPPTGEAAQRRPRETCS